MIYCITKWGKIAEEKAKEWRHGLPWEMTHITQVDKDTGDIQYEKNHRHLESYRKSYDAIIELSMSTIEF